MQSACQRGSGDWQRTALKGAWDPVGKRLVSSLMLTSKHLESHDLVFYIEMPAEFGGMLFTDPHSHCDYQNYCDYQNSGLVVGLRSQSGWAIRQLFWVSRPVQPNMPRCSPDL